MSGDQLNAGAVKAMYTSQVQAGQHPVVQIIDIKKVQSQGAQPQNAQERYRLIISDGVHYQQAMLGTQQNHLIRDGKLKTNAIVRLSEHICNTVNNRRIIIILNLELVADAPNTIGTPQNIENVMQGQNVQPIQQQQQQPQQNFNQQQNNQNNFSQQNNFNNNRSNPPATISRPVGATSTGQPISKDNAEDISHNAIVPVNALNPYHNRWTIKVRVTTKGPIKNYSNDRTQDGKLFSFDVVDREKGELRITMFNEIVNIFQPHIHVGNVYFISRGQLKIANKKFTTIKNEYELSLNANSIIQQAQDDGSIGGVEYQFTPIATMIDKNKDEIVDVIGVVLKADSTVGSVKVQSTQKEVSKRNLTLVDRDGKSIDVTLWNKMAEEINPEILNSYPVLAIKGAKVSDYNGRTLNTIASSTLTWNPDMDDAHQLRGWFDTTGGNPTVDSLTQKTSMGSSTGSSREPPYRTFAQFKASGQEGVQPERFSARATITLIKHDGNIAYKACSTPKCNRKVSEINGSYLCDSCNSTVTPPCVYILALTVSDYTGSQWLSAFNEAGEKMLNMVAGELTALKDNQSEFDRVFNDAQFKMYKFRIRAKQEMYNGESRTKCSIEHMDLVDFAAEGRSLLVEINKYI